ncbi:plasmid recombination protein [Burkholderia vietnamiensis]|uniref:plasmid recombination protein n=1 Tax=Burkholderia vietnamiensis TaxID=60552 RepID=UPI0015930EE1|nr:plasmid recombination protein [Burkholderia vietnamiensis]MCA8073731.1 plasmid recombination protein [Burkholderia vietnamiensis]
MAQKYKSKVKPQYAILRTKKLKSKSKLTAVAEHNLRLRTQANIDADRSHLNQILYNPLGIDPNDATSFQRKLSEHYSDLGIKIKTENTLAFEYVATASPKFFEGKTTEQIGKWAYHQTEFMRKEFGDRLQLGILHLDESTPHIHFLVSTECKSIKKYKNRYGACEKETWSLNSEKINPEYLRTLQDNYATSNKIFGLSRGVKYSKLKNTTLKTFYRTMKKVFGSTFDKALDQAIQNIEISMGDRLSSQDDLRAKIKISLKPVFERFAKSQKALQEAANLDVGNLQEYLKRELEKLEIDKELVAKRKEVYREWLKDSGDVLRKLEVLETENMHLKAEIERFEASVSPPPTSNTNPDKSTLKTLKK